MSARWLAVPLLASGCGLWIDAGEVPEVTVAPGDTGNTEDCAVLLDHSPAAKTWRFGLVQLAFDRPVMVDDITFSANYPDVELDHFMVAGGFRTHVFTPIGDGLPVRLNGSDPNPLVRLTADWGCGTATLDFEVTTDGDYLSEPAEDGEVLAASISNAGVLGPLGSRLAGADVISEIFVGFDGFWHPGTEPVPLHVGLGADATLGACDQTVVVKPEAIFQDGARRTFNASPVNIVVDGTVIPGARAQIDLAMSLSLPHRVGRAVFAIPVEPLQAIWTDSSGEALSENALCETERCFACAGGGLCAFLIAEDARLHPTDLPMPGSHDPCLFNPEECPALCAP